MLVVVLLDAFLEMQAIEITIHFGVIVALGLLAFFYRNRTTLSADALIGATLVGYILWLFGGWQWLVAPLILFATYTRLLGRPRLTGSREFHADVLLAIVAPGVALVTAYEVLELEALYLPYVAVWSANLAIIGTLHRQLEAPDRESEEGCGYQHAEVAGGDDSRHACRRAIRTMESGGYIPERACCAVFICAVRSLVKVRADPAVGLGQCGSFGRRRHVAQLWFAGLLLMACWDDRLTWDACVLYLAEMFPLGRHLLIATVNLPRHRSLCARRCMGRDSVWSHIPAAWSLELPDRSADAAD